MSANSTSGIVEFRAAQAALQLVATMQLVSLDVPKNASGTSGAEYDYIVVGGGTAGCVIASRLSEDEDNKILLIEAGDNPQLDTIIPGLMVYVKGLSTWDFTTADQSSSSKQKINSKLLSQGKVLGGSSATNYARYETGNHYDYDSWAKIVEDETWRWDNVLPYLKKSQRLSDSTLKNLPDREFFGKDGPIGLTVVRKDIGFDYLEGFRQMGNKIVPILHGNITQGYANAMGNIDNNIRQSTILYIFGERRRPNLHVLKNTIVKRVIFNRFNVAIGVEACTDDQRCIIIKTRKEVILSAGAFFSPQILMLSGIGPKEHLTSHNIATISDLPVGKNLQDHVFVLAVFNFTKTVTHFKLFNPFKYPASVTIGLSSSNKSVNEPDLFVINYINFPRNMMKFCIFTYDYMPEICDNLFKTDTNTYMMFSTITKLKFKSRGKVVLKSGDYRDMPAIYPNYYANYDDLDDHARLVQQFVKVGNTEQFKKIGAVFKDPEIKACNGMDKDSREYWKCYVLNMARTQQDFCGTCAMGTVVDSKLRVKGVHGLRVADASVMPHPVAGGIMAATIMIGEKVSDMIKINKRNSNRY